MKRNFWEMIEKKWSDGKYLCVGLDPDGRSFEIVHACHYVEYLTKIVETTFDLVCAYKINSACFEEKGVEGSSALQRIIQNIRSIAPNIPIIFDAKRGDVPHTARAYAKAAFERLGVDAITVNPYMGFTALIPFLEYRNKGVFVLCRTSNEGAAQIQDQEIKAGEGVTLPLHQMVAIQLARMNKNNNCGLVMGAIEPERIVRIRRLVGDMPLLIPGIGEQGGDLEATVRVAGSRMIISASRSIIFEKNDKDYAEAARRKAEKIHNRITEYRTLETLT